jgi:putative zinc finger/helix-turn-helix YgiT family protein
MSKEIKTAICENCDDEVTYKVIKRKGLHMIGGNVPVEVELNYGICDRCGRLLNPAEFNISNDIILYDEYRRIVGLLTSEDIKRIRNKRGMSQVELARFIHCGEKNIARYERGTVQDPVFDYLIRLVDDDKMFEIMKKLNEKVNYHYEPNKKEPSQSQ